MFPLSSITITYILLFSLSDFLMMVLRDLVTDRRDLRVVLMSATLNSKLFSSYFYDAPVIHIPGTVSIYISTAYFKTLSALYCSYSVFSIQYSIFTVCFFTEV